MINRNVCVEWEERDYVASPWDYTDNPTMDDFDMYKENVKKATHRYVGIILDFKYAILHRARAIVACTDDKIREVGIDKLKIIKDLNENTTIQ